MYMCMCLGFSLEHTREEVLEQLYILAVHTNEECTIWRLDSYIDVVSYSIYRQIRHRDTESRPELCYE